MPGHAVTTRRPAPHPRPAPQSGLPGPSSTSSAATSAPSSCRLSGIRSLAACAHPRSRLPVDGTARGRTPSAPAPPTSLIRLPVASHIHHHHPAYPQLPQAFPIGGRHPRASVRIRLQPRQVFLSGVPDTASIEHPIRVVIQVIDCGRAPSRTVRRIRQLFGRDQRHITAAKIATRCFPGAVRVAMPAQVDGAATLLWPDLQDRPSFGTLLGQIVGTRNVVPDRDDLPHGSVLLFGDGPEIAGALRVTFDGWVAMTGPVSRVARLPERPHCSLAGILAATLSVSELFLSFADVSLEATRRTVALSLWRPDLDHSHPDAIGPVVQWLPSQVWVLGLGHLGNACLWALGTLPYQQTHAAEIFLNDFDSVEVENIETGLLFTQADLKRTKARTCAAWLEGRGFRTRLLERRFDSHFRCQHVEPRLALCGFDSNPSHRELSSADFVQVIESGLGGMSNNFDTLSLHVLPNPRGSMNSGRTCPKKRRRSAKPTKSVLRKGTKRTLARDSTNAAGSSSPGNRSPFLLWGRPRAASWAPRRSDYSTTARPMPTSSCVWEHSRRTACRDVAATAPRIPPPTNPRQRSFCRLSSRPSSAIHTVPTESLATTTSTDYSRHWRHGPRVPNVLLDRRTASAGVSGCVEVRIYGGHRGESVSIVGAGDDSECRVGV